MISWNYVDGVKSSADRYSHCLSEAVCVCVCVPSVHVCVCVSHLVIVTHFTQTQSTAIGP